jgi:hypothetical protein
MNKQQKRKVRRVIVEYGVAAILGVVLYILIRPYAVAARGSTLYGGEVMMFGMPAYWAVLKSIINDVKQVLTERNYQDN